MPSSASEVLTGPYLRQRLRRGGSAELRIHGNSMAPVLASGSLVRLRRLTSREALKGLFVAVELGSKVVVHRVDSEERGVVHTRGLRSPRRDTATPRSQVIGVVSERLGPWALPEPALSVAGNLVTHLVPRLRRIRRW